MKATPDKDVLISIIIATLNEEKNIKNCIESVLNNVENNFEIIIKDGGSKDKTISIVKQFRVKNGEIIIKIDYDSGIYNALNQAISGAKGRYIYFLGADDRLLPGFKTILSKLDDPNKIYYGTFIPNNNGRPAPDWIRLRSYRNSMLAVQCINHQTIVYPTAAVLALGFDERYNVNADWDMNIKLWGNKLLKKEFFPFPIVESNLGGFSSFTKDEAFIRNKLKLIKKSFGELTTLRYLIYRRKRRKNNEHSYY